MGLKKGEMAMDQIDRKLLQILSQNAAATATEMVPQVNLSIPAINKRIQKLQKSGVIRRFTIQVEPAKVGKPICAFILVVLHRSSQIDGLMEYIQSDPDILECYGVTGEYDYLLKVCTADVASLQKKINHLKKVSGVVKSHTMMTLIEYKNDVSALPDADQEGKETQL